MFITTITRALHLFLSWARPIWYTSSHPTSPRCIPILSAHLRLDLASSLFLSGYPIITYTCSSSPPFPLHAHPSHPPQLYYSNYTWRRVQIMKLLLTLSFYTMFLPQCKRPSFTSIQNHSKVIVSYSYIQIFKFFDNRQEDRRFRTESLGSFIQRISPCQRLF
jgi:hypothetical protein